MPAQETNAMHRGIQALAPSDYELIYENLREARPEYRLSIVTPTYNRGQRLINLLGSLAAQTCDFSEIEMVVVDDGGDPAEIDGIKALNLPFRLRVYRQPRQGRRVGRARNVGIKNAAGGIVLFLDADAWVTPGVVREHLIWHGRNESVAVMGIMHELKTGQKPDVLKFMGYEMPPGSQKSFYRRRYRHAIKQISRLFDRSPDLGFCSMHASVKRRFLLEIDGFDESFDGCWGDEDLDLGFRLEKAGVTFQVADWAFVYHQWHPVSLDENVQDNRLKLLLKHPEIIGCGLIAGMINPFRVCTLAELQQLHQREEEQLRLLGGPRAETRNKIIYHQDPHPGIKPVLSLVADAPDSWSRAEGFLSSLQQQTLDLKTVELVVTSRGHSEGLADRLRSAGLACKIWCVGPEQGECHRAAARNLGLRTATSDLLVLSDMEAVLGSAFLEEHYQNQQGAENLILRGLTFDGLPDRLSPSLLSGKFWPRLLSLRFGLQWLREVLCQPYLGRLALAHKYSLGTVVTSSNCSFRRSGSAAGDRRDEQCHGNYEDLEFFHRLCKTGRSVAFLNRALVFRPRLAKADTILALENLFYVYMRHPDLLNLRLLGFTINRFYCRGIAEIRCWRLWCRRLWLMGKPLPRYLRGNPLKEYLRMIKRLMLPAILHGLGSGCRPQGIPAALPERHE
jgi:glycosyltransferase involved in cell wall biosynthesis